MIASSTRELVAQVPQQGRLTTILLRRVKRGSLDEVGAATLLPGLGLEGDHRATGRAPSPGGKRHVTLLQAEHLPVIAALTGRATLDPAVLRRNLVVAGINLASLRTRTFRIGDTVLEGTGWCHPCSRMEETLGSGGFQAVRGHGGITARVVRPGPITVGDDVRIEIS